MYVLALNALYLHRLTSLPEPSESLKDELEKLTTGPMHEMMVEYNNITLSYFCLWLGNEYTHHKSALSSHALLNLSEMLAHFGEAMQDDTKKQLLYCCQEVLRAFSDDAHSDLKKLEKYSWIPDRKNKHFNSLTGKSLEIDLQQLVQLGPMSISSLPSLTPLEQELINLGLPLNLCHQIPKEFLINKWFNATMRLRLLPLTLKN